MGVKSQKTQQEATGKGNPKNPKTGTEKEKPQTSASPSASPSSLGCLGYYSNPLDRLYYIGNIIGKIRITLRNFLMQSNAKELVVELNTYVDKIDSYLRSDIKIQGKSAEDVSVIIRNITHDFVNPMMGMGMPQIQQIPVYEVGEAIGSFKEQLKKLSETEIYEQYRPFIDALIELVNSLDQYIVPNNPASRQF
jgi:hypothetical protein